MENLVNFPQREKTNQTQERNDFTLFIMGPSFKVCEVTINTAITKQLMSKYISSVISMFCE